MTTLARRSIGLILPLVVVLIGFGGLLRAPAGLLVDDRHPYLDHAAPPDTRGIGNDLTTFWLPRFFHDLADDTGGSSAALGQWDPTAFCGRPAIGNPQTSRGYPPYWLALSSRWPAALGWLTLAHLVGGGIGLGLLVRTIGAGRAAAAAAGGFYAVSPYLVAQTMEGHYPHVWAACLGPWAVLAFLNWISGRPQGALFLPILLSLAFLTGHPQEWYLLLVSLSVAALVWVVLAFRRSEPRAGTTRALTWGVLVALSLTLSAGELLPQVLAQEWTLRPESTLRSGGRYYVHTINLLQLVSPSALGGPTDYFGHDNYWETLLSVGLTPLILAILGVSRHPNRSSVRILVSALIVSLILAGGHRLGLYSLASAILPGWSRFRVPGRWLLVANLGMSTLAGLGLDVLIAQRLGDSTWRTVGTRLRWSLAGLTFALATAFVVSWTVPAGAAGISRSTSPPRGANRADSENLWAARGWLALRQIGTDPILWGVATGLLAAAWAGRGSMAHQRRMGMAIALIGLAEVALEARRVVAVSPLESFRLTDDVGAALHGQLDHVAGPSRVAASPHALTDLDSAELGIEKTSANDSFQIGHTARLYERLYPFLEEAPRRVQMNGPMDLALLNFRADLARSACERLGVAFVITTKPTLLPDGERIEGLQSPRPGIHLARVKHPLPRCYVVPRSARASLEGGTVATVLSNLDPREVVVLDEEPRLEGPRQSFREATWQSRGPDRTDIRVTTEGSGFLVIANTWMPGWTAQVDGVPTRVYRGDFWLQVVPIPRAGNHIIEIQYQAPGRSVGLLLGATAWVGWLVWAFVCWLKPNAAKGHVA